MKIGIIGGTKGLGKTLAWHLVKDDFDVTITGRDINTGQKVSKELGVKYSNKNGEVAKSSDILIISVPIASTKEVISQLAPYMQKESVMIDVTSVKEGPTEKMNEVLSEDVEFIPTHPIFGPRTTVLDGQVIVLTPLRKGKWYPKVYDYFERKNMRIIETTAEHHDYMMAVVQVLTHFSYISTASAFEKLKVNIKNTKDYESPVYNLMIDTIARIVAQNPFLTYSIQNENRMGDEIRQALADAVLELKDALSKHDEDKFVEIALRATRHMGDIQAALGRSDKAIDSLTKEFNELNKSIGKEIGLRHIYSGKVHMGVIESVDPDFLKLKTKTGKIKKLKIANIEILKDEEIFKWKMENEKIYRATVSCVFPINSNGKIIQKTLANLKDITEVSIKETYNGPQIKENDISYTFHIEGLNKLAVKKAKDTLKGFGGIIR